MTIRSFLAMFYNKRPHGEYVAALKSRAWWRPKMVTFSVLHRDTGEMSSRSLWRHFNEFHLTTRNSIYVANSIQVEVKINIKAPHLWYSERGNHLWPVKRDGDAESVSMSWRHHESYQCSTGHCKVIYVCLYEAWCYTGPCYDATWL